MDFCYWTPSISDFNHQQPGFHFGAKYLMIKKDFYLSGTGMLVCIVKYACLFLGSDGLLEGGNLSLPHNSLTNRNIYRVTPCINSSGTKSVITDIFGKKC